jgi:hypothetical protein
MAKCKIPSKMVEVSHHERLASGYKIEVQHPRNIGAILHSVAQVVDISLI